MTNMIGIFVWLLVAFVLQTTLSYELLGFVGRVSGLEVLQGATIDFVLITLSFLVIRRDLMGAFLWTSLIGIVTGSFGLAWKGAQVVSFFVVGLLGQTSQRGLLVEGVWGFSGLVGIFTLVEGLVHVWLGGVFNQISNVGYGQVWPISIQIILNMLASPILFYALSVFDQLTMERTQRSHGLTTF